MKIRQYTRDGKEIKNIADSCHKWKNNSKENRPEDFVVIKQLEIDDIVTDPYGEVQEVQKLSDPVEEVYCGWEWDNGWNCLVRMVVKKEMVILDRRPNGWKFFEDFNAHRPNFLV